MQCNVRLGYVAMHVCGNIHIHVYKELRQVMYIVYVYT